MGKRSSRVKPLLWLMHGGPGTGKSHVVKIIKEQLFEKELQWEQGIDFQVTALQAVNADSLDGDTLHHALGLQPFLQKKKSKDSANTSSEKAAKKSGTVEVADN